MRERETHLLTYSPTHLLAYSPTRILAAYNLNIMSHNQTILDSLTGTEIAVIGMAARFPGAADVDSYWANLRDGVESIQPLADEQLRQAGVDEKTMCHPRYVKAAAILDKMEQFDAPFFGFSSRDAAIMDPQHRHFLEVSWEALEHAGYDPARFDGIIGVYGGSGHNAYLPYNILTNPELLHSVGFFLLRHTGNDKDFLTTRVSYLFDLRGPSVNVQTACSTSLVAIHLACQSLLSLECDMALAGGVTIELPHGQGYIYEEGEILSPDGHCRPFDAASQGTVFGSGAGVVVLRRLDEAIKAGDTIHAVIKGSAINNDGSGKMNYLAPSVDGQAKAIAEALTIADAPASSISYVEAHGTGTPIGDPIEVQALTQAFRATSQRSGYCGLGSVKSNIGHLDTAAGVASFIKVVQALKHQQLPPTLHFQSPNPLLNLAQTPFYVNHSLRPWASQGQPRRAGVSSLGVGGTNAHIILEEAPKLGPSSRSRPQQLLLLTAKSKTALEGNSQRLAHHLRHHPEQPLADIAYTTQMGRQPFRYRRVVVGSCHEEIAAALESQDRSKLFTQEASQSKPAIGFFFPGGGAQYLNMGRDLYDHEPLYRQIIDEGLTLLRGQLDFDLKAVLFPERDSGQLASPHSSLLEKPAAALPALFLTEYALARLWLSWGIEPAVMIGHSMGEYTAACLAGVFSFADALSIVTLRGKLFETLPAGGMLSVSLPEVELRPHLFGSLDIAVLNSPTASVVSGPLDDIEKMAGYLDEQRIEYQRVPIDVAAHSPMLEPILAPFEAHLRRIRFNPPQKPYISNVTGTWVRPQDATDPLYWVRHLRHTVRFADGVATALQTANLILLEVGPGKTLTSLARQHPDAPNGLIALTSLRHVRETANDQAYLLTTLGRLWGHGAEPDWPALYPQEIRHRVPLPTYSFDHQRYWIEPGIVSNQAAAPSYPRKQNNLDDWFYRPTWTLKPLPDAAAAEPPSWLIFLDQLGVGERLAQQLQAEGHTVTVVTEERQFTIKGPGQYALNQSFRPDYLDLVDELAEQGRLPQRVVHLWGLTPEKITVSRVELYEQQRDNVFYSTLFLTQALSQVNLPQPVHITLVSNGMQALPGEPLPFPEKAIALGLAQVIGKEFTDISCQCLDVVVPPRRRFLGMEQTALTQLLAQIRQEALIHDGEPVALWRGRDRWVSRFEAAKVDGGVNRLRPQGVYLITGGLGGIGLVQARLLAQTVQARLVLTGRTGLPPRETWDKWLATREETNKISQQIRTVRELESLGAEVLLVAADVSNREQVRRLVAAAKEQFGTIHGVIHAAGVLNDGLIQLKAAGDVAKVFSPKIRGTLLLDEALADTPLDFFVLFSSTSTVMGPVGQVDYVGANAFLDAFAQSKTVQPAEGSPYTLAINWGMWSEVGMAVAAAHTPSPYAPHDPRLSRPMKHPFLGRLIQGTDEEMVYETTLGTDHWLLNEHRLKDGTALVPGTGYLEMAWAARQPDMPRRPVEIRDLFFVSPLDVAEGERKTVRLRLVKEGNGHRFTVASQSSFDGSWQEHALAQVTFLTPTTVPAQDAAAILARCNRQEITFAPGQQETNQERFLRFGPRWKNVRQIRFGDGEVVGRLELDPSFHDDLAQYPLHPALLDLATGIGLPLVPGYHDTSHTSPAFYVPLTYRQVRVYAPLTPVLYTHLRHRPDAAANQQTATFDVTLMDESGRVLVEVNSFTVRRVGEQQNIFSRQTTQPTQSSLLSTQHSPDRPTLLDLALSDGIKPEEGAAAFQRLLTGAAAPRTIVSSLPLADLLQYTHTIQPENESEAMQFARPAHLGEYVPPENEAQRKLAEMWQKVLGLDSVGIHDDFFDLGGDSLMAIRLVNLVKKGFGVELSLATIFQTPTVAQMITLLPQEEAKPGEAAPTDRRRQWAKAAHQALVPIQTKGDKPPFFVVHGAGGHVLVYSPLADYLGLEQPFYGLQAVGVDGKQRPLTNIEAMADLYLQEVRQVQPHGPYYLGGFSMGGEVAFAMANKLKAAGEEVALLVLFDTFNPVRNIRGKGITATNGHENGYAPHQPPEIRRVSRLAASRRKVIGHVRRLRQMGVGEQVRYLWEDGQRRFYRLHLKWAFERAYRANRPMSYAFLEDYLWETNLKAITNYMPQVYPGQIILFRSTESLPHNPVDHPLGWGPLARDGVQEYIIDGPHRIMDEPYIADVARILQQCLDEAQAQYAQLVT